MAATDFDVKKMAPTDYDVIKMAATNYGVIKMAATDYHEKVVLLQFSLYVHKGGLKPDSFHFCFTTWR